MGKSSETRAEACTATSDYSKAEERVYAWSQRRQPNDGCLSSYWGYLMRFRHIMSETRAGLRQNLTMTLAVIMTMWVSLSLFGAGLLASQQPGAEQ